jgi:hypothetical protein
MKLGKIKSSIVVAALALTVLPQTASADRSFGDIYKECGLGAMIFTDMPVGAVVSNIIWDLGTSAILSNMSSKDMCKGGSAKVAAFINQSYDHLEKDLASGEGKYLKTLADLAVTDGSSKEEFVSTLRKDFSDIVASNDYSTLTGFQKAEKLYNAIY